MTTLNATFKAAAWLLALSAMTWQTAAFAETFEASTTFVPSTALDFSVLNRIDSAPEFGAQTQTQSQTKTKSGLRKAFNYVLDTRGTDMSKEGADVATDKTSDVSSVTTDFYKDQIRRDSLHWEVVSLVARLADALGHKNGASDTVGYVNGLRTLIGEQDTEHIFAGLTGHAVEEQAKKELQAAVPADLQRVLSWQQAMYAAALQSDPIIASVRNDMLPYNSMTKDRRAATKVTYTGLQIASFVPTIVAPLAQTSLFGVVMANGGSEADKLLKELYYAKRFDKRQQLIRDQVELALHARESSIATGNPTLYHFSRELAKFVCGQQFPQF